MRSLDWIGWIATAVFSCSYFVRGSNMLRRIQACAALMWVVYGFLIGAMPVVVANVIVAAAAVYSSFTAGQAQTSQADAAS
jgi:hypothetical protein